MKPKNNKFKTHTGLHVTDGRLLLGPPLGSNTPVLIPPPKHAGGRPSTFTPELAQKVLDHVAEGRFLVSLKEEGLPSWQTVYGWADRRPEFTKALARAHEDGAHALLAQAETMLEAATRDTIQVVRERVAHIRWRVSRLNPAAYGDRSELRVSGTVTHEHRISDDAPAWIKERLVPDRPAISGIIDITPEAKPH